MTNSRTIDHVSVSDPDIDRARRLARRAATELRLKHGCKTARTVWDGGGDYLPRQPGTGRYIYVLYFGTPGCKTQQYSVELREACD